MKAFYNDVDDYPAQWLRNLIKAEKLPGGDVVTASIEDLIPNDLQQYDRCHFFAGIGSFPLSLQRLGWPDQLTVWTGGCPCQPFSVAGKGKGFADERHLWPAWFHLISQQRPSVVIGEQVASKDADPWLDLVQSDLESLGYTFGCIAFPAASIGAPHIRDRIYWVGYTDDERLQRHQRVQHSGNEPGRIVEGSIGSTAPAGVLSRHSEPSKVNGSWGNADWVKCKSGRWRPVRSGTFPLADGVPSRVGRLRAYGNTVCVGSSTAFVDILMDTLNLNRTPSFMV